MRGVVLLLLAAPLLAQDGELADFLRYEKVVGATARMARDRAATARASRQGLQVLDLTWEDTGRFKDSAVGPNISDMTIQVQTMDPRNERFHLHCMPVIRYPNFSDKTCDVPLDRFELIVGNERPAESVSPFGGDLRLRRVTLREYLGHFRRYLTRPDSWKGRRTSLLAERDTHVLVSAQACFLPIPRHGLATFNPVLFNYQSYAGDPAVLAIIATREGTSATVIDNKRDGFVAGRTWGQRLFFNQRGERASLTGKRLSDHVAEGGGAGGGEESGLNMVLLIQVPLRQREPHRFGEGGGGAGGVPTPSAPGGVRKKSDVEEAVIGHGRVEGPFTEIDGLEIRRDARFPIRVTVQFYKATSNGVVSDADVIAIGKQIRRVYAEADYVGSLVTEGHTGRPTEYQGIKREYPGWWHEFWLRHEANTGQTRYDAMVMLRELLGRDWMPGTPAELDAALKRAPE